jgi:hypothetical protein
MKDVFNFVVQYQLSPSAPTKRELSYADLDAADSKYHYTMLKFYEVLLILNYRNINYAYHLIISKQVNLIVGIHCST